METFFSVTLKGSKANAVNLISFLESQQNVDIFNIMKDSLKLPNGFTHMKDDEEVTLDIRPESSGNFDWFDCEDAFKEIAASVPDMDMKASFVSYVDGENEIAYISPSGSTELSEYYPIYCAACGKELANDEIVPDEEGNLYCQECANNGFCSSDE